MSDSLNWKGSIIKRTEEYIAKPTWICYNAYLDIVLHSLHSHLYGFDHVT